MHMLACVCVYISKRSSHWATITGLNLIQSEAFTVSLHIFGGHRAWRGGAGVHYIPLSEFQGFPSVCVCVCVCVLVCVCTNECVCSIGCSWVAKQPCVCTLEWGWEEREAPGQQRQTLTGIAASDWTHRCS